MVGAGIATIFFIHRLLVMVWLVIIDLFVSFCWSVCSRWKQIDFKETSCQIATHTLNFVHVNSQPNMISSFLFIDLLHYGFHFWKKMKTVGMSTWALGLARCSFYTILYGIWNSGRNRYRKRTSDEQHYNVLDLLQLY